MISPDVHPLESILNGCLPEALRFLEELVAINSFTQNRAGVDENAERIVRHFAPLGLKPRLVPCSVSGTGSHLILDSGGDAPAIACISHLDTVYPLEEETKNGFTWKREGSRAFGPGVYDIKGGTALLWMTLQALASSDPETFRATRWILLWNAAEEVLAEDFGKVCLETLPSNTLACLVFEGDGQSESFFKLVSHRKGSGKFRISTTGRGAHSGSSYKDGANAIHQLARVIDKAMALTDLSKETTVNVGTVRGGSVTNRVPHEAEAHMELRAFDQEHYMEVRQQLVALSGRGEIAAVSDGFPCQVQITIQKETPPWQKNDATDCLAARWQDAAACCGEPLEAMPRGGLSDGNRLWNHFPTLDGLGPRGGNAHCSERSADGTKIPEFVDLTSFVPKALINCIAIRKLTSEG